MNEQRNRKSLDDLISRTIDGEILEFDFNTWKKHHQHDIHEFKTRMKDRRIETPVPTHIWRTIIKSKITKLAAAAVVILALLIGIHQFGPYIDLTSTAWARVVKAFNEATDIHVVKRSVAMEGRITRESESWISNQTLYRAETHHWCIIDDGREVLTLYKDHKIAHVRESRGPYWDYTPLILKVFRDNEFGNGTAITRLPQEGNDEVHVYQIYFGDYWQGKAWVDAASNLPMRVAGLENEGVGQGKEFEMAFAYEPIPDERFKIVIPPYCRELPCIVSRERPEERAVLFGTVVDEQGYPVAGAVVRASYAEYDRTDENGRFALAVPPSDASNSLSPRDFPMFVWAFEENEPYRVAWTIIRHRRNERRLLEEDDPDYGVLELTERGVELVKLVIRDEDELNESIAGNTGEFFSDLHADLQVQDIVLVMEQGSAITGWVNNSFGEPIVNASVGIEELQLQLGGNRITVSKLLGHDLKGNFFAVTDDEGNYSLRNLPACWKRVRLKAVAPGHRAVEAEFESDGDIVTDSCALPLLEGAEDVVFF